MRFIVQNRVISNVSRKLNKDIIGQLRLSDLIWFNWITNRITSDPGAHYKSSKEVFLYLIK